MSDPSPSEQPAVPPVTPVEPIPPIPPIAPIDAPPPTTPVKRTPDPAVDTFFLPAVDDRDPLRFRGPIREVINVTPIVDGAEIFKEFETQIAKAELSVLIAFWSFDPLMPMVTDKKKTWNDLLLEAANRKVMVRVLMNDFDPGLQFFVHASIWKRYFQMSAAAAAIPLDHFQIVCSHHEAETAAALIGGLQPKMFENVANFINLHSDQERFNMFSLAPGIWDKLALDASKKAFEITKGKSYPICPAAHHQKIVIIDGKFAYTGGVNLTADYDDSRKHGKKGLPWHDAFVKVEGALAVQDFIRNYIGLWNKERIRAEDFLKNAFKAIRRSVPSTIRATTDLTEKQIPAVLTSTVSPKIPSQVHRTITVKGTNPTGVPDPIRIDILEGYIQAIKQATEFIYIENQYLREREIADALINQHSVKKALQTIILLPRLTEEHLKGPPDSVSERGAALQFDLLKDMISKIKSNLGLFALAPNLSSARRKPTELIYVHSKLIIIDDKFASIGSANLNPRSFRVDTELDFVWHNEDVSKKLRIDLWNEALGKPSGLTTWKPSQFISKWSDIAKKNKSVKPRSQKGFVIPFDNTDFGAGNLILTPFT